MKNLALATILISLSGTALSAAVDTTTSTDPLPTAVQADITEAQAKFKEESNPITPFIQSSTDSLNKDYTDLNDLLNTKGYLKSNPHTIEVQNQLKEVKTNLQTLTEAEDAYDIVGGNLAGIPHLIAYLKTVPVPKTFPGACATYKGQKVAGRVQSSPTRILRFYYDNLEKSYGFLSEITDVGLINSGAEYTVSGTPGGQVQDGYLGTDPQTKKEAVVCLSQPYTPTTPTTPTEPDKSTTSTTTERTTTTETKK